MYSIYCICGFLTDSALAFQYIIANLGMSPNFGEIDFNNLEFPTHMLIDWIRVYQHPDRINIGCDPPNFPTSNYIERYIEAYTNPNLTVSNPFT
jgi:hypothetical protein